MRQFLVSDKLEVLREDFPNAMMHFNHFIRPHQQKIIHRDMLLLLMARGAGRSGCPLRSEYAEDRHYSSVLGRR